MKRVDERPDGEVNEELSFHLERLIEEYRAAGLDEAAAREAALQRFGDVREVERSCRELEAAEARRRRPFEVLGVFMSDLRFAARQLRDHPLATLAGVLTLALGIGANTAIFSVVNGVLLRPLPYPQADRVMVGSMSLPDFRDVTARALAFEQTTVWASNVYAVRDAERPEEIYGAVVEPAFFEMLGRPALGRGFDEQEQRSPLAVISHALWQRRWGGDPAVLGQSIDLSGTLFTVVGVMAPVFQYPDARFDVWVPFAHAFAGPSPQAENRALRIFRLVGRRADGVSEAAAVAEVSGIAERLAQEYPQTNEGITIELRPLREQIVGDVRPALVTLLGVVALVLVIACANVANLLVGQRVTRAREMSIRSALGAGRSRLIRQLLTESVLLAAIGGTVGLVLAGGMLRWLRSLEVALPRAPEISLDVRVLLFSAAVSLLTVLLFGLAPAVQGSRVQPIDALRESGRGGLRRGGRLRAGLAGIEVALAMIVLAGAGLLIQSLVRVLEQDIGFEAEGLVSMNVGLFYFDEPARRAAVLERVLDQVARVPGVQSVAGGSGLPPQTAQRGTAFEVAGRTLDRVERAGAYWLGITPGYFATLGARIVRGREFDAGDVAHALPIVLVSEGLARSLFGESDPIGRQIRLLNPDQEPVQRTVVGVVEDIRYQGVENAAVAALYTPFAQTPFNWSYLMVRSDVPADRIARALRDAIGTVDGRIVPARIQQHTALVSDQIVQRRFVTTLLAAFAAVALALVAVGVYGVIASGVAQQRRDIGVRIALGAHPHRVVRQVVTRAMALVWIGLAIGLLASLWLTRLLNALLYDVRATDPVTFAAGASVITLVGLCASAFPARRAARLDPARVLRE